MKTTTKTWTVRVKNKHQLTGSFSLEFENDETSNKYTVLKRLMFCAVVLNITFVAWGVSQVCVKNRKRKKDLLIYIYIFVF